MPSPLKTNAEELRSFIAGTFKIVSTETGNEPRRLHHNNPMLGDINRLESSFHSDKTDEPCEKRKLEDLFHERANISPKCLAGGTSKESASTEQEEEHVKERSFSPVESAGSVISLSSLPTSKCPARGPLLVSIPIQQLPSPARMIIPLQRSPSSTSGSSHIARRSPASSPLGYIRRRRTRSGRKLSLAERMIRLKKEKNRLYEERTEILRHALERKNDIIAEWLARFN